MGIQSYTTVKALHFGTLSDGSPVELYTLRSASLEVSVSTFGGRIVDLKMLGPGGTETGVVLGFKSLRDYIADQAYLGALIGRYANRIAHGQFNLGARTYHVTRNEGVHSLHGGRYGFDQRIWRAQHGGGTLTLAYTSKCGEEGYPGDCHVTVRFSLLGNELRLEYEATATAGTPVNLTNHTYFNLSGDSRSPVLDHRVTIRADKFTPVDGSLIPTGELRSVSGTPFDFRQPHAIGERIESEDPQLLAGQGYDHNWVLTGGTSEPLPLAAEVCEPGSGRVLEVLTSEPGIQFYTGNQLNGPTAPGARGHTRRCGFCLETQHFPDSPNHSHFPSTVLEVGGVYRSQTTYRFSVRR
jgi:aldose 1-epimerase